MSHGVHDGIYNLYKAAALIQSSGADIVLIQDVDVRYWDGRSGCEDQPTRLGELIGYLYPHQRFASRTGGTWFIGACGLFVPYAYGIMVLSKVPINDYQTMYLPQGDGPEPVVAQAFTATVNGLKTTFANTHLTHTQGADTHQTARTQQALAYLQFVNGVRQQTTTWLSFAGGDFNAKKTSSELASLAGTWSTGFPDFIDGQDVIDLVWLSTYDPYGYAGYLDNGASDHRLHLERFWFYSYN